MSYSQKQVLKVFCNYCKAEDIGKDIKCDKDAKVCPFAQRFIIELNKNLCQKQVSKAK